MSNHPTDRLAFDLPPALEATAPAERRDSVRMLVARRSDPGLTHTTFDHLPDFLDPGDLVVVNTSGTLPGAVDALGLGGSRLVVHLSTELEPGRWVVELRLPRDDGTGTTERWDGPPPGRHLELGEGASLDLEHLHLDSTRLWVARLDLPLPARDWLALHGRPIRYGYVRHPFPIEDYQNVYAVEPGSAEMASAGRPFTPEVITALVAKGVGVAPIVLHTGVASLEADELPYPERVVVPQATADAVRAAKARGDRVIAIGTTVVRALETAGDAEGIEPFDGWTDLVITPERGVHVVDGMLTGWHEPEASHLLMLEAVGGRPLLERSYAAALEERYLWHEFGDVNLLLP